MTVAKKAAVAGSNMNHKVIVGEYQKVTTDMTAQVNALKATVDQVEKEREFYFSKLREIELYIQTCKDCNINLI